MKKFIKYLTLFLIGGVFYYSLEVIFRGYSFPAMAVCGGLCFIICGVINERSRCMPLVLQQLIAASGITVIEFIFGLMDKMGQLHPKEDDEMDPEEDTYL